MICVSVYILQILGFATLFPLNDPTIRESVRVIRQVLRHTHTGGYDRYIILQFDSGLTSLCGGHHCLSIGDRLLLLSAVRERSRQVRVRCVQVLLRCGCAGGWRGTGGGDGRAIARRGSGRRFERMVDVVVMGGLVMVWLGLRWWLIVRLVVMGGQLLLYDGAGRLSAGRLRCCRRLR